MTGVRVCKELYPAGFSYNKEDGFEIDQVLKGELDIIIKNVKNDWDFTILITGKGNVRVGKSVLAMQIAAYLAEQCNVPFGLAKNFVFDGEDLIKKGHVLGQGPAGSPLIFDEAGADLEGKKIMMGSTKKVLDFFRECGQYNLFNILIIPDFFDLPKGIALNRSICLINVYAMADENDILRRGFFDFYNKPAKKKLYLQGKKDLDYNAAKYTFHGVFRHFYPVDEVEYRKMKQEALRKRDMDVDGKVVEGSKLHRALVARNAMAYFLNKEVGYSGDYIADLLEGLCGKRPGKRDVYRWIEAHKVSAGLLKESDLEC